MKEYSYDQLLNIKTGGDQKGFNKMIHYHRYEPTPYSALEELCKYYKLASSDRIVDFGCGKGRLAFYIHHQFHSSVVGIEMNDNFYQEARENKKQYEKKFKTSKDKIDFYCCLAEEYKIHPLDNCFYFFNPFSIQIFMKVIKNILLSVEESQREVEVILYYASDDYIFYLENHTPFELNMEVIIPELYEHNSYERFLVYRLPYCV